MKIYEVREFNYRAGAIFSNYFFFDTCAFSFISSELKHLTSSEKKKSRFFLISYEISFDLDDLPTGISADLFYSLLCVGEFTCPEFDSLCGFVDDCQISCVEIGEG